MIFENIIEVAALSPTHPGDGVDEFAMFLPLDELPKLKLFVDLPMILAGMLRTKPVTEVSCDGGEVRTKAIGGDRRNAVGVEPLLEIMDSGIAIFIFFDRRDGWWEELWR